MRGFILESDKVPSRQAHFDMLIGIHEYLDTSKLECHTRHTKEYQDDVETANFNRWAHLKNPMCLYGQM